MASAERETMNHNYIPKQPIVQAFQLTRERWDDRSEWPWWLMGLRKNWGVGLDWFGEREGLWIVRSAHGDYRFFDHAEFEKRYSPYLGQRGSFGAREEKS